MIGRFSTGQVSTRPRLLQRCLFLSLGLLTLLLAGGPQAQELAATLREEVVMVKKPGLFTIELETSLFRPQGEGPFPLVLINHGKAPGEPRFQGRARYLVAVRELVQRGYAVVVPMRQGFSKSGGSYIGAGCNVESNGHVQAEDVQATLQHYAQRPDIDASRVIVFGQSHGGLTTLAFGTLNLPNVVGLVNFAGGLRQDGCVGWEQNLARAFGNYGRATRVPSLWFYGDNDSFWSVPVWTEMHRQYTQAGPAVRLVAFGSFGNDAHGLFAARAGVPLWLPEVRKLFASLGLPFEKLREIALADHDRPPPPDSGFAAVGSVEAVPYLRQSGREAYLRYLDGDAPKAFALAANGVWGARTGIAQAMKQALENCRKNAKEAVCKLYAVDDRVVWAKDAPP